MKDQIETKKCPHCSIHISEKMKVCFNCGYDIFKEKKNKKCPRCGIEIDNNLKFCPNCNFTFKH